MMINEAMKKVPAAEPHHNRGFGDAVLRHGRQDVDFGDKVLLAGYYYNGRNKPCCFGAAYEFLTDDHTCEGMIGLRAASGVEFEDDGHAIAWAMQQ